ncbi:TonB-dependent receptor domain-containing protein [Novosphingobium sp. JCM 18896]|uniref:TonB-dependent receptor domain-containing protein n=1 Tax=Novosphingobium sp. JCM 18896 TaxID=2989731 RepID=UPI0022215A6B|nr:TonB-dependent receptor [Novosphingobium sp. JCM 18896]MCW1428620.1 TonB-dependent receptor [Novosphingobium sp. JCM 18896]
MKAFHLLLTIAPIALATPAWADTAAETAEQSASAQEAPASAQPQREVFSTGVAKGRDILDSAISTSSIRESQVQKLGARSLFEIFHNIAGVRSELSNGEVNNNVTVRGLPMASTGAKFLQVQEDGLPVVEFGDMLTGGADMFIRADLNLAAIEAIRGGSASTFASNSPAGIINLMSKTGDVEGGSLMLSSGIDYEEYRADFDYGAKISDTLRFHVGGYYRQGEGPRKVGYDAVKGGQFKFNITKEFTGGHIRLYGKFLDDSTPVYLPAPMSLTGTNDSPKYAALPGFDNNHDTLLSRYHTSNLTLDGGNNVVTNDLREGAHSKVKSVGVEAQFDIAGWTVTDRFRYSQISGRYSGVYPAISGSLATVAATFGGPGATLRYASGPSKGQLVPANANGNGLVAALMTSDITLNSFDNITNDFRASKVWNLGGGELTTTAGFYKSRQSVDNFSTANSKLSDIVGGGNAALVDITTATGVPLSENGYYTYDGTFFGVYQRRALNVDYDTNAAFGSLNFKTGPLAIGGSLRYDFGGANGYVQSYKLSNNPGSFTKDMNGNGVISAPERKVGFLELGNPSPVDYTYNYLSYSVGVNYRVAEPFAVFARYSRGARVNSDRLLFSSAINANSGSLANREALIDYVKQAEAGFKYRTANFSLNGTAFLANTLEHNSYFGPTIDRKYKAYGLELESSFRAGIFSLTAGATYTKAEITNDKLDPTVIGNKPVGSPSLFGYVTPEISTDLFSIGANFYGISSRYASDSNLLKMPGYVLVNPFVQVRPVKDLTVSLNVNNLFDAKGITTVSTATIPANGIGTGTVINGRTVSASVRFDF